MLIELDVHGLTIPSVIKMIQRLIVKNPNCSCIEVIHGYNSGSKIKEYLKNKTNIHNKRVAKTLPTPFNEGRTMIFLKQ